MLGRRVATALHASASAPTKTSFTAALPIRIAVRGTPLTYRRLYATPGRPKKAVGEPGRPIKRVPKAATTSDSANQTTSATRRGRKKDVAAESAKAKARAAAKKAKAKAAAEKVKAKDAAAKMKAAEKRKATAVKAEAQKARKKEGAIKLAQKKADRAAAKEASLTTEQRENRRKRIAQAATSELKKLALDPPSTHPLNAYAVFRQQLPYNIQKGLAPADVLSIFREQAKEASAAWTALSPAEREHFNQLAARRTAERQAAYKSWLQSHTVEQIRAANAARSKLRRQSMAEGRHKKHAPSRYRALPDERVPKRTGSAYIQFFRNRASSTDFRGIAGGEKTKLIAAEWRALSDSEKAKYKDISSNSHAKEPSQYNHINIEAAPAQQQAVSVSS